MYKPRISHDTSSFWEKCKSHKLSFQKCSACGYIRWPAASFCPVCGDSKYKWIQHSGYGKIYSFVAFHRSFAPRFNSKTPYIVAAIDLDNGPTIISNIVEASPSELECGERVRLLWGEAEGMPIPVFTPKRKGVS
jgi:uncharacterized OB-fold protein